MKKKAQSAMEFLMTYGWGILAVVAAISALAYFGVVRPMQFVPERCMIYTAGVTCLDYAANSDQTILLLSNSGLETIDITHIKVGDCEANFNYTMVNDGSKKDFIITGCTNGAKGSTYKGEIIINYTGHSSAFPKTLSGTLTTKIE